MQTSRCLSPVRALVATLCVLGWLVAPAAGRTRPDEPVRPTLVMQVGHSEAVESVAWSPDGRLLATSGDETLRLWDVATGRELRAFDGGGRETAFSPDGRLVAVGNMVSPPTIHVFDVETGREYRSIDARNESPLSIAFSPDGRRIASGGVDKTVRVWDLETGAEVRVLEGHRSLVTGVAFGPEGGWLASASWDSTVKIWDMETGSLLREMAGHKGAFDSLAVTPDGRSLATGGNRDGAVILWDAATGQPRATFAHKRRVLGLAFSPDGSYLASGSHDKTLRIVEVASGREVQVLKYDTSDPSFYAGAVMDVAFSPDGKTLAAATMTRTVNLWDLGTGLQTATLGGRVAPVESVAVSAGARYLAAGRRDGSIKLWELPLGRQIHALASSEPSVGSLAFAPDGATLLSRDGVSIPDRRAGLTRWDVVTGRAVGHIDIALGTGAALSQDGRRVAAGTATRDGAFVVIDAADGGNPSPLTTGAVQAQDFAFSPDGRRLAVATGKRGLQLVPVGGTPKPDPPGEVVIWTLETKDAPTRLAGHAGSALAVAWAPDGRTIASGGEKGEVKVWDAATGRELRTLETPPSGSRCDDVVFSPDGRLLAVAHASGAVDLWDAETGRLARTLAGHDRAVEGVAFTPDGRRLFSASDDGSVGVWDPATGERLATIALLDGDDWLVTTPGGLFDGTPDAWGAILWRFSERTFDVAPVEAFFNDFYRPGLLAEVMSGAPPRPPSDIARKDRRFPRVRVSLAAAPADGARTVSVRVDVAEAAPGAGVRDVRLFRNGSLVKVWRGDVKGGAAALEAEVPVVAGENRLAAYAFNRDDVKSEDAALVVVGDAALARKGTLHVVAVGVDRYANRDFDLKFAAADASAFVAEFTARQGALDSYAGIDVVTVEDARATRAGILEALGRLATARPEDTVVVYFAGHGIASGDRFYLVPHDLGYAGPRARLGAEGLRQILRHSISDEELERAFERVDAGNVLLVVDACDSGQALEAADPRQGPMNSRGLAQLAYEKGMYVLTGSQAYQAALEASSLGHGYLTYALVEEGLKTAAADTAPRDGEVMVGEWLDFAVNRVPELQRSRLAEARKIGLREDAVPPVQRPRVFYRRERGTRPFPIARP